MSAKVKVGTYTGTGAIINLEIGFIPEYLQITNITDGDIMHMWFDGMTADTSVDIAAAVVTNAAGGVTRYTGAAAVTGHGVTLGTDASESAKVYRYVAMSGS